MNPLDRSARQTVIGVARVRLPWFAAVASWANSSLLPIDFLKCLSVAEASDRLADRNELVLLDAGAPGVDAKSVAELAGLGAVVVVVDDPTRSTDTARWAAAGAAATLSSTFERQELAAILASHSAERSTTRTGPDPHDDTVAVDVWRGAVIAVTGVRGTGVSTVAMALAQGLAARTAGDEVALVDLARDATHALYHDIRDVMPGVQELCEAAARPGPLRTRECLFAIDARRYSLLAGVRRGHHLDSLGSTTVAAAVDAVATTHRVVVADVDADAVERAGDTDLVVAVGDPTLRGLRGLVRVERSLIDDGVEPARIVRVVNRSPRSPRARAELSATIRNLGGAAAPIGPLYLPARRGLEVVHQVVGPLPDALTSPLAAAIDGALQVTRNRRRSAIVGNSSRPSRQA